jgi:flagellar P-ring protein precursor FlgI
MRKVRLCAMLLVLSLLLRCDAHAATRVKDIAYIEGVRGYQLIGYGLVVGLNGSGDTQRSTFTLQSVSSMLKRFGITVVQDEMRLRNVAAVMVTATAPGFAREGGVCDVTVSSMGDATSLQGGTLLMTPLSGSDGTVYAMAQGPLSVGGASVRANGNELRRNHTAAGRIPGGALLERSVPPAFSQDSLVNVALRQADFTTAVRIAEAVNTSLGGDVAHASDGSTVSITVPSEFRKPGRLVEFISQIELLEVLPDVIARVVINERTGTVVVGGNVTLESVAISHGGLNIDIQSVPVISQPAPWGRGETVLTQQTSVWMGEDSAAVTAIEAAATVQDVARALNTLGVTPRDIIAIFQALREAGALKAEVVVI